MHREVQDVGSPGPFHEVGLSRTQTRCNTEYSSDAGCFGVDVREFLIVEGLVGEYFDGSPAWRWGR